MIKDFGNGVTGVLITEPATEPLTVAEARMHLRNPERTDNDAEIIWFIKLAREQAEHRTGRVLMAQTWDITLDRFPGCVDFWYRSSWYGYRSHAYHSLCIQLPLTPLKSVTSITYPDSASTIQTVDPTIYIADDSGCIRLAPGKSWPASSGPVTIREIAGYGGPNDVPESIKSWMKLAVAEIDQNRGLTVQVANLQLSPFAERLLDKDRVIGI